MGRLGQRMQTVRSRLRLTRGKNCDIPKKVDDEKTIEEIAMETDANNPDHGKVHAHANKTINPEPPVPETDDSDSKFPPENEDPRRKEPEVYHLTRDEASIIIDWFHESNICCDTVKQQRDHLQGEYDLSRSVHDALQANYNKLKDRCDQLDGKNSELQAAIMQLNKEKRRVEVDLDGAVRRNNQYRAQVSRQQAEINQNRCPVDVNLDEFLRLGREWLERPE
ncbi:hypothetical protein QBC36DRAFT_295172 [Triangularia setosa]|uniref:Uncharacterized protein n=1 Tax=Triangularia setosa TaxID=2587417 RepID=A0AAN6VZJ0_9PEZI|nr:hypothetical protein QBC36DRAFT_295172 [Podospora setosa]